MENGENGQDIAALMALRDAPPVHLLVEPLALFFVIAYVQLSLRHPATEETSGHVRAILEQFRGAICKPGSPVDRIIERGFDPQFDVR